LLSQKDLDIVKSVNHAFVFMIITALGLQIV